MPRAKNKIGRERDRLLSSIWTRLIRAGKAEKKQYMETAREVEAYLSDSHNHLYESEDVREGFMDFEGTAAIALPLMARLRNSLGPRLYQSKPVRTITPTGGDGVMLGLSRTMEAYVNYTVRESKFPKQFRRSVDDGLVRGRAVLQHGYDEVRGIVTSTYLASTDLVFDPDFDTIEDARWIAIRRREPFWETEQRVTDGWRLKNLQPRVTAEEEGSSERAEDSDRKRKSPRSSDQVEYWIVLSKMGKGFRAEGKDHRGRHKDDKDFQRLEITLDHDVPLAEGGWDVPFYLDRDWPISYVDFVEPIDKGWPESPGSQVLSVQKAADLLTTVKVTGLKNRERLIVLCDAKVKSENQEILRNGSSADFISMTLPNNMKISDAILIPSFGTGAVEIANERAFLIGQIEAATGVTEAVHGSQESQAKDRSATASQIRGDASSVRIQDMIERAEELGADAGRKEAIIARLTLGSDEVSRYVRPEDIRLFYVKVDLPGRAVLPVRDVRPEEDRKADPVGAVVTLEQLSPVCATYFGSREEALMAVQQLMQDVQTVEDPRLIEVVRDMRIQDVAQEDGMPLSVSVVPVDVERVWADTSGMTAERLMREHSYTLASGSGQKINKAKEQANAQDLIQTTLPALISMGDYDGANKILEIKDRAFDVPQDQQVRFNPPPPPQEAGAQQTPSQGGSK